MRFHLPTAILTTTIIVGVAVSGLAANAQQDTTPTAAETVDVTIGGYAFEGLNSREPVIDLVVSRTSVGDGAFVGHYLAVQEADGTFTGATKCDDVVIPCLPFTSPAKAGLKLGDNGDQIPLAGDGK